MAFQLILKRSISNTIPSATKFIVNSQRKIHYVAATSTAFSSLNRATWQFTGCRSRSTITVYDKGVSSDKKLLQVVQSEIDDALQSDDQSKYVAPPSDFPFSFNDNPGEQTVTLSREYNGETITVEVSMPSCAEENEVEDDNDDSEEPRSDSSVLLLVNVAKNNRSTYLEFDCTAYPDEIKINGLSLKKPEIENQLAYEGPDFYDLDENLQKAFYKYLEVRGVKPSTTSFLHEYMIEKDNKEYIRWLKDVKNFVEA